MIYTVNDQRINDLSLEQLILFMFKDYPEIIKGYGEMISLFREKGNIEPIENLKLKFIGINLENIQTPFNEETEKNFADEILLSYSAFDKYRQEIVKLQQGKEIKEGIKISENNEDIKEKLIIDDLIETLDNIF